MKEYLKNFESLCNGNAYIYSQPKFKEFRQSIDKTNYFDALKEFDKTQTSEVADALSLFFRRILEQPFWYIEAVELYPNDKAKQAQYLYDNIELAKDRLFTPGRGVTRIIDQLDKLAKNNKPDAQRLYEEILYILNDLLKPKNIGYLSFDILNCNLKGTPLFVVFMEFIEDIKHRAGNPYHTEIDNYLNDIENYKAKFQEESQEPETPAPPPQGETTAEKIEKALKELKGNLKDAFIEPAHIDKIIEALAEYAKGTTPDCVENQKYNCANIKISSKDFYTPFKGLNKTIGLTIEKIAEVLHYFIHANDGSQNAITKTAIEQNIKRKYPKVI